MASVGRRDFLKWMGMAGTTTVIGCSEPSRRLIPYIHPPENVFPGKASWFASTCRECPAGCGLLAKNRDARVIKVEGNPHHPVSAGKLCPRGQASLHGLYNPDRFQGPMVRIDQGPLTPASWEESEKLLIGRLSDLVKQGKGERVVFLTGLIAGTRRDLVSHWLSELGSGEHVMYEPLAYESLRKANEIVFGSDTIPFYRIDRADFLISFGAGFLETWLSNVEYARQFADFHEPQQSQKNPFIFIGPRHSMTAANADLWLSVAPGDEYLVALGLIRVILDENLAGNLDADRKAGLESAVRPFSLETVATRTGVDAQIIRSIARRFMLAKSPLVLAEGLSYSSPNALEAAVAANFLCALSPALQNTIDFAQPLALSESAPVAKMRELAERMNKGEVDLLLIHEANPIFALPSAWNFSQSLERVPMVVSFSSTVDETSRFAHLILPTHTFLESWGDYSPRRGVIGLMQPTMGNVFPTRQLEDILLSTGKAIKGNEPFPWSTSYDALLSSWRRIWQKTDPDTPFELFWLKTAQRGGIWEAHDTAKPDLSIRHSWSFPLPESNRADEQGFDFVAYPSIQFYDGRMANRPWIQELPDPITQVTWGGWVEIHPAIAEKLNFKKGDLLQVTSPYGTLEAPALPIHSVPPGTVAMPMGQGHTEYGRYATGLPANPLHLFPADVHSVTGAMLRPPFKVTLRAAGGNFPVANTDGSFFEQGRDLVPVTTDKEYTKALADNVKPEIDYPLPMGWNPDKDFYPPHFHHEYRWCMVVDLDRCIGCGACVVACYAENNVAVVGREQMLKQREMSWIRAQRYFDFEHPGVRWLVMLCQHCDSAPCESVCPIFAPQHSIEGLNNQVYNRCFGTRFCSQNDPYKVRRFNWYTFTRAEPLDFQLNPDVTVRQKGVMEKCSFCVQRIIEAKIKARNEGRKVQDGDFTTACAQTCPTSALIFGNLKNPESRVSKLINNPRAYQVFRHLNTKPAVIYLKRITQEI